VAIVTYLRSPYSLEHIGPLDCKPRNFRIGLPSTTCCATVQYSHFSKLVFSWAIQPSQRKGPRLVLGFRYSDGARTHSEFPPLHIHLVSISALCCRIARLGWLHCLPICNVVGSRHGRSCSCFVVSVWRVFSSVLSWSVRQDVVTSRLVTGCLLRGWSVPSCSHMSHVALALSYLARILHTMSTLMNSVLSR
jgi:hypothetical protein